jgi:hypothetical protein
VGKVEVKVRLYNSSQTVLLVARSCLVSGVISLCVAEAVRGNRIFLAQSVWALSQWRVGSGALEF